MRAIVTDRPGSFRMADVPAFGDAVGRVRAGRGIKWHIRPL